ncbi:MAG TPA: hypothetical protein DD670_01795 [Planctomycetaceae bacterium]|nr:hypothetical protein [Planctomycetaceae bacterium]
MKWLLARLGLPKAIGLSIEDDGVALSRIVATPWGPVEIDRHEAAVEEGDLRVVIPRLLSPLLGKSGVRKPPLSVSLSANHVYFSTRPVHASTGDSSPHVLLREAFQSQSTSVGDMVVDVIKSKPDSREVAGIVACNRAYLSAILDSLRPLNVRLTRTEPAPCTLLRFASRRYRTPGGAKVVLRLFLAESRVLTMLVVNKNPLLWRFTSLTVGEEAASLVMACRALWATGKACGIDAPLDAIVIHGRANLKRLLDIDWIEDQLELPLTWFDGPTLDQANVARGAALGALDKDAGQFDLGRTLRPDPSLGTLFPWREVAVQLILLACMAAFLGHRYWSLFEERQEVQIGMAASAADPAANKATLLKEKKRLENEVGAVRGFLDSRTLWTACLRDLSLCLPDEVSITSVRGAAAFRGAGAGKRGRGGPSASLVLQAEAPLPPGGETPEGIDKLIDEFRAEPAIRTEFPLIKVDGLSHGTSRGSRNPAAMFTITLEAGSAGKKASGASRKKS